MISLSDFSALRICGLALCLLDVTTYWFIVHQASLRKQRRMVAALSSDLQPPTDVGPLRDDAVMEEMLGWVYRYRVDKDEVSSPARANEASATTQTSSASTKNSMRYYENASRSTSKCGSYHKSKNVKKFRVLPTVLEDIDGQSLPDLARAKAQRTMLVGFRSFEL
jgi:hypothetical protein